MKRLALFAVALALLLALWFLWPRSVEKSPGLAESKLPGAPVRAATPPAAGVPPPAEVSHLADSLNAPAGDIRADLRIVADLLDAFRSNFPHDGNPVGDNAEITAALVGKNKFRFAFIAPNHPAIDARGELCDRWGTPFFFHAESGTHMTVRSAGPDKKIWTADDVVSSP